MYPGSPIHQFDKLDYEETCHDLDIEETESDNIDNETRGDRELTPEEIETWIKNNIHRFIK